MPKIGAAVAPARSSPGDGPARQQPGDGTQLDDELHAPAGWTFRQGSDWHGMMALTSMGSG